MSVEVIQGDALALPLDDASVDLIVTSPPYFGLRSYQDGGEHYDGQIGDEATPAEFVDALIAATREMVRVLKPEGSIWVNLGDKYVADNRGSGRDSKRGDAKHAPRGDGGFVGRETARQKSLIGVPWRYALRCIDDLGLILRAEVIWSKPNGLPESVTDRVRRSHETWFAFQKSGGVEAASERFPFCPLCGRPVDARTTLVARLHELHRGSQAVDVAGKHVPDERVEADGSGCRDGDVQVVTRGPLVPGGVVADIKPVEHVQSLDDDRLAAVVDADAEMWGSVTPVAQADSPLAVDDAGEPSEFCVCGGHPLIIDEEPWIPQSLAAELMQMVSDGAADPQSVADYLSGDFVHNHSVWFHFTKRPRYFSAVDEIREPAQTDRPQRRRALELAERHGLTDAHRDALLARGLGDTGRSAAVQSGTGRNTAQVERLAAEADAALGGYAREFTMTSQDNPLGKLPGSVWTIATQPLVVPDHVGVDHFAAFPMEWPRRIIRGWSPESICVECGQGRRPVAVVDLGRKERETPAYGAGNHGTGSSTPGSRGTSAVITGYACGCDQPTADTTPAVVLDPFGGTGTTALVAHALGRHGISVDLSSDYCRLARWRTTDPGEIARARLQPKPKPVHDGQEVLW